MIPTTSNRRFAEVVPIPTATAMAFPSIETILGKLVPAIQAAVQFQIARTRAANQQQLVTGFPFAPAVLTSSHPPSFPSAPLPLLWVENFPFTMDGWHIQPPLPGNAIVPSDRPTMLSPSRRSPSDDSTTAASNGNGDPDSPTPPKTRTRKRTKTTSGAADNVSLPGPLAPIADEPPRKRRSRQQSPPPLTAPVDQDAVPAKGRSPKRRSANDDSQLTKPGKEKGKEKGKGKKRADSGTYVEMKVINGCGPYVYERQYIDGIYKSRYRGKGEKGKPVAEPKPKPPKPTCPDCGSHKTVSNGTDKQRGKRCYKCPECFYRWRIDLEEAVTSSVSDNSN